MAGNEEARTSRRVTVQDDWEEASKAGSFWISLRQFTPKGGTTEASGKVQRKGSALVGEGGFEVSGQIDRHSLTVQHAQLAQPVRLVYPRLTLPDLHKAGHISVDLAFNGSLGVSGGVDGTLRVWDGETGRVKQDLQGHVGDVYCARLFPSGQVVLSCGADTTLRVWDVNDGWCGAVLKGHTGGVFFADFVDRGRNVVSCSRDGFLRLWDCSTSSTITRFRCSSPLTSCVVTPTGSGSSSSMDNREVGTVGKCVAVAATDGHVRVFDLGSRDQVFDFALSGEANAIALSSNRLVVGTEGGAVVSFDVRNLSQPVSTTQLTNGAVSSVCPGSPNSHMWVSSNGGLCGRWAAENDDVVVVDCELTGPNLDPVTAVQVAGKGVATGCRDGVVRVYSVVA